MFFQNEHFENKMNNKDIFRFRKICVEMYIRFDIFNNICVNNK